MAKIDIDKLSLTVIQTLKEYSELTAQEVEKAVVATAKETVKELKTTSPVGATGEYAKNWTYKRDGEASGRSRFNMIVHSKKPDYRLTHLLEYGHAKVNGGRVAAIPHIKAAEINAEKRLLEKLKSGIGGIK